MSHANGQVRFSDGTIMHCEYDGTSDFMRPVLFTTYAEMREHWRGPQPERDIPAACQTELAEAAADYGSGWTWWVRASKGCGVIVDGFEPSHLNDEEHGLPDWWE